MTTSSTAHRRRFLRFLAASPLFAEAWAQQTWPVITSAKDAVDVMDFEEAARKVLPPAHWGYMASGVDDDFTQKMNREGFKRFQLRPRRLVDGSKPDLKTEIFGVTWETPIFLCPVGGQRMFHPDGEIAVARAARAKKTTQILSTATSTAVEDVAHALGSPLWYQLYMPNRWEGTEKLVRRVEEAGCPVVAWTVDELQGRNMETAERFRRLDTRDCVSCHATARGGRAPADMPMFKGIPGGMNPATATWDYVDRLKKLTKMKLLLKGLDTREDARLAREHGVDGIIVSNHGGRSTETGRSTIEALGEVVDAAGSQIPVLVDGGFRHGTDVYKALALGARGVGIGRPYVWGLSAFGQEGVERVLDILHAELGLIMRQCGTPTIAQITRASVMAADSRL
ncbi:MAG: alpha-hydroxy-acid oxidizing protein [Acidobacteriota bacterium]|jgi:4-hydroxymandelate oxidase|nr:alpha-hydroxy-acid oxidizing protein [Acidobacteriota bacterium]